MPTRTVSEVEFHFLSFPGATDKQALVLPLQNLSAKVVATAASKPWQELLEMATSGFGSASSPLHWILGAAATGAVPSAHLAAQTAWTARSTHQATLPPASFNWVKSAGRPKKPERSLEDREEEGHSQARVSGASTGAAPLLGLLKARVGRERMFLDSHDDSGTGSEERGRLAIVEWKPEPLGLRVSGVRYLGL